MLRNFQKRFFFACERLNISKQVHSEIRYFNSRIKHLSPYLKTNIRCLQSEIIDHTSREETLMLSHGNYLSGP